MNNPISTPKTVKNVPSAQFASQAQNLPVNLGTVASNGQNLVLWTVNGTSMIIDPGKPTLRYVADNNLNFPQEYNVVSVSPTAAVSIPVKLTLTLD
jgi:archaellum component FlaG (FlaF/FlaG flagellin family)